MIHNNTWVSDTAKEEYAAYDIAKPTYASLNPYELELGPVSLNASDGDIKAAWWLFEYNPDDQYVYASKWSEITQSFEVAQPIFQDVDGVSKLSATFDQLGRPIVFYQSGTELRLYWFDPVLADNVLAYVADGSYPFATFDIRWDTSSSASDALLFYVRDGGIYYRLQRDRYVTEHATPVTGAEGVTTAPLAVTSSQVQTAIPATSVDLVNPTTETVDLDVITVLSRTAAEPVLPAGWTKQGTYMPPLAPEFQQYLYVYVADTVTDDDVTVVNGDSSQRIAAFRLKVSGVTEVAGVTEYIRSSGGGDLLVSATGSHVMVATVVYTATSGEETIIITGGTQLGELTTSQNRLAAAYNDGDTDYFVSWDSQSTTADAPNAGAVVIEFTPKVDVISAASADKVLKADMTKDYRLQVLYRYIDENYSPPAPVPPTTEPVPVDAFWAYKLNGYQSRIATGRNLVLDPLDQFTVSFDLESVQLNKPVIGLFSQNLNPEPGLYGAALLVAITGENHDVLRTVIGGVMGEVKLPFSLQPGHWVFDFMLDGGKRALSVKLRQPGELEYIEAPLFYYPVGSNKESAAGFTFGAVNKSNAGVVNALAGMLRNCRLQTSYWPFDITIKVDDKADGDYPKTYNADDSVNAGFVARILDYNSHSWQFVK